MKKYSVILSPKAMAQVAELRDYITAKAGSGVTKCYIARLRKHFRTFKTFPHRGTRREDLRPGLRLTHFEKNVSIAFFVDENKVRIIGVYYGGQDIDSILARVGG